MDKSVFPELAPDSVLDIAKGDANFTVDNERRRQILDKMAAKAQGTGAPSRRQEILEKASAGQAIDLSNTKTVELSGDTRFTDYTRGFGKGTVDIVGSILGIAEMTGLVDPGALTGGTDRYAQQIVANMSPSARKNLERKWTELGPEGVARNPKAFIQQLSAVAPSVLASLIPAAGVARGVAAAGKGAKAAKAAGTAAGIASEAAQVGGATYNEIRNHMGGMTHAELMANSPHYQKAYARWGDEAEARREVLLDASRGAAAANALWAGLVAAGPARLAARYGAGERFAGTRAQRAGKGFAIEAAEETAQEVPGGYLTGSAIQSAVDARHDPTEGMAERAVSSFFLGGGIGGALGAMTGGTPTAPGEVDPAIEGAVGAQLELPLEDQTPGPMRPQEGLVDLPYQPGQQEMFEGQQLQDQQQTQLDLPLGQAPELKGQFQHQTEMDFGPDRLPILPQDVGPTTGPAGEPIPSGPPLVTGQPGEYQNDMFGYDNQPYVPNQDQPLSPVPPQGHIAEPIADVRAQVEQMLDGDTHKRAVYIDPPTLGDETQARRFLSSLGDLLDTPGLVARADEHGGLILSMDEQAVNQYFSAGQSEQARAELLGYVQSKDQLVNPDKTLTVAKLNKDGTVAESQVVDAEGPALENAQLSYFLDLKPDQRVTVTPTGVALQERSKRALGEADQMPLPLLDDAKTTKEVATVEGQPRRSKVERTREARYNRKKAREAAEPVDDGDIKRMYRKFKARFEDFIRLGPQNIAQTQGDMLQGSNELLVGLDDQARNDVETLLDMASATGRDGLAERRAALEEIDLVLGGTGDMAAVARAVADMKDSGPTEGVETPLTAWPQKETPATVEESPAGKRARAAGRKRTAAAEERKRARKARKQKKAAKPIDAAAEALVQEARTIEDRPPKQFVIPMRPQKKPPAPKTEEDIAKAKAEQKKQDKAERKARWAERQRYRKEKKPHPGLQSVSALVDFQRTIREALVKTFGVPEKIAKQFKLHDRDFMQSTPLDKKQFEQFMTRINMLEQEGVSPEERASLINALINRKALDKMAQRIIQSDMTMKAADAYKKVQAWRKAPDAEPMPEPTRAKLNKLYDTTVSDAYGESAELEALISEQAKDDAGKLNLIPEGELYIPTEGSVSIAGELESVKVITEDEELVRSKSGESKDKGPKTKTPRRKKSQQAKDLDAILGDDGPAPGTPADGQTNSERPDGQGKRPIAVVVPEGGTPDSIGDSVFESEYPRLDIDQRDGVRILWQRILDNPEGAAAILGDGTGVGKTAQLLVVMDMYRKAHPDAKLLLVVPKEGIYRQFQADAVKLGIPFEGVDRVNYGDLKTKAGSDYDLVLYDEAQKIAKATNSWSGQHGEINAKHTLYATATPGDKEENLALIAAANGQTLPEMVAEIDKDVKVGKDGIDAGTIKDRRKFLRGLADRMKALADSYGFVRRALKRESTAKIVEIKSDGGYKITLSDGRKVSPKELESMWMRKLDTDARNNKKQVNVSQVWAVSERLSELAKMHDALERIDTAIAERRKALVLYTVHQSRKGGAIEVEEGVTVDIPVALKEMEKALVAKYPGEVGVIISGRAGAAKVKAFQEGDMKVILSTYESVGEGLNLDGTVAAEDGGWGRELIMMTDNWGADQMDQAHGRVERRSTKITPVVVRLRASDFQNDQARDAKLRMKEDLQKVLRGQDPGEIYSVAKNLKVTETPGEHVGVRIQGMPPENELFKALRKKLKAVSDDWRGSTQEWMIPKTKWTPTLQEQIAKAFIMEEVSTVETKVETKPKKTTPKAAAKEAKTDDSPDLSQLSKDELEVLEEKLQVLVENSAGDDYIKYSSAQNDVYDEMARRNDSYESIGSASVTSLPGGVMRILNRAKIASGKAALRALANSKHLSGPEQEFVRKIAKHMGNTKIVVATDEEMAALHHKRAGGLYQTVDDTIYIRDSVLDTETLVHEAVHAVMHHAIDTNLKVRGDIFAMRHQAAVSAQSWKGWDRLTPNEKELLELALKDDHEFVSYGVSNANVIELLMDTEADHRTLLQKVWHSLLSAIGLRPSRIPTLSDKLTALVERHASTDRKGSGGSSYESLAATVGEAAAKATRPIFDVTEGSNAPQDLGEWYAALRRKTLGFSTPRQIESVFARLLNRLPDGNPIKKWLEAMHKKAVEQKKYATLVNAMHREYMEAVTEDGGKYRADIEELFTDATLHEIWPNVAFDHKLNAHLKPEHRAMHERLSTLYKSNKSVRTMFDKMVKFYADEKAENFDLRVMNIIFALQQAGHTVSYDAGKGVETKITDEKAARNVAENLRRGKDSSYKIDNFIVRDEDGKVSDTINSLLKEAVANDQRHTLANGPYLPLKRFGEWVVTGEMDRKTWNAQLDRTEVQAAEDKAAKRMGGTKDKWTDSQWDEYRALLTHEKQKVLRKKLVETRADYEGHPDNRGVEAEAITFNGDSASVDTVIRWVSMHESEAKAKKQRREIAAEGWTVPDLVTRKVSQMSTSGSVNSALVAHVKAKLGVGDKQSNPVIAALEASIIDMMPETAIQKSQLRRKGITGAERDHGRALAAHGQSAAWYRGTLMHGKEIGDSIALITKAEKELLTHGDKYSQSEATAVGDALREIRNHINLESGDRLNPLIRASGEIGFLWLLVSPAYLLVNLTQPAMYTLPWLKAREGQGMKAWKAFKDAYAVITPEIMGRAGAAMKQGATKYDIDPELFDFLQRGEDGETVLNQHIEKRIDQGVKDGKLSAEYSKDLKRMLEELSENNVLDMTLSMDTTAAAEGKNEHGFRSRTMDVARILPHLTEVLNRTVTAVAAYEMARSQKMSHEQAVEFATQGVVETQFDYTLLNKPRYMSERYYQLAKPIFMFMQHPQHVYGLFVQSALVGHQYARLKKSGDFDPDLPEHQQLEKDWKARRDTVVGVLATHLAAGGMVGAMFEPTKWALGLALAISEAITGEPPEDTEVYVRRWTRDFLGEDMGRVVSDGLPAALGLHLSGNLSISNLSMFGTPARFGGGREGVEDMVFSGLGPVPNLIANAAQGYQDIQEGDVMGGLSKMAPRVLREPIRAMSMSGKGLRDTNGHAIIGADEMTPLALFYATLGLQSAQKAQAYERKGELDNVKQWHRTRRKRLTERLYRARGDGAKMREVQRDIDTYNATLPYNARMPRTISANKAKAEKALQDLGAVLNKNEQWLTEGR